MEGEEASGEHPQGAGSCHPRQQERGQGTGRGRVPRACTHPAPTGASEPRFGVSCDETSTLQPREPQAEYPGSASSSPGGAAGAVPAPARRRRADGTSAPKKPHSAAKSGMNKCQNQQGGERIMHGAGRAIPAVAKGQGTPRLGTEQLPLLGSGGTGRKGPRTSAPSSFPRFGSRTAGPSGGNGNATGKSRR